MFAIYLATPLALFWLMDRYGVLNDTAVFAAIVVGAAYPAILNGSFGGLKTPDGWQSLWKPVDSLADAVTTWITERSERNTRRLQEWVVRHMVVDQKAMADILQLARTAPGAENIDEELKQIDKPTLLQGGAVEPFPIPLPGNLQALLETPTQRQRRATKIYIYASSIPDFERTIQSTKIINDSSFYVISPLYRSRIVIGCMVAVLLVACGLVGYVVSQPSIILAYNIWRFEKTNASAMDLSRTKSNLRELLENPTTSTTTCNGLCAALQTPGLSTDRIDSILQTLLETRSIFRDNNISLPDLLTSSLRVNSPDSRSHIHQALLFLALERDSAFLNKTLSDWNPGKGNSVTELEKMIGAWESYWHPMSDFRPSDKVRSP